MITRVKLKNWKSHRDTELRFGDGTNVLVGTMGAGKSSVLDGITYSLFGTLPAVQTRRIKLEDLITSRPKPLDRAEVEVNFVAPDGNEYIVKRVIERGSGTALSELRKATSELIESPSSSRVNELVQSLLELDYDLFERAIYSEQNRLDYFLMLPKGKRMESIDELLGINKLEKVRKSIVTLSGRLKDRALERETTANQLKQDPSISTLAVREQELEELESAKEEISARLQQLQPELESTRAQVQTFLEIEQNLSQFEHSHRELTGAMGVLRQQLDEIREKLGEAAYLGLEELQKRADELNQAYSEKVSLAAQINSNLAMAISELQALETQKKMLQVELDKMNAEIARRQKLGDELKALEPEKLLKTIENAQTEFRELSDELATSRSKVSDMKVLIKGLSGARAKCPVCDGSLSENRRRELIQRYQKQLEDLNKRVNELDPYLKRLYNDLRRKAELQQKCMMVAKEVSEIPKLEEELLTISKKLDEASLKIPAARESAEKLRLENERARKEVNELYEKLSNSKQLLRLRIDLNRSTAEYKQKLLESERVQQAIAQLKGAYDEAKAKELRKRLEELVGTQERLRAELSGKEQLLAEKMKFIKSIREKLAMISRCEAEVLHLRDAAQTLATIQTALARTQTSMRRMFIDGVNEVMSDLWESIYPYGDFVGIQLAVEGGERGGDYVLKLRDRAGGWVPVEGVASGGERTDACLALRIAFSIVLAPNLKWIVFDEPTHNLDAEGIQELAKILRERLPEVVRQILIITHEERLESAVSGYLYRFSRDKDSDEPTKVEQVTVPELFE